MNKLSIEEAIVVEGRDDEIALRQAVDALIIKTHGFGIRQETWKLIEKAYQEKGIIIFTDPDFSGEEIRKKITQRFPDAKQAYLPLEEATKDGDIGVENATPSAIQEALSKVHSVANTPKEQLITIQDLEELGMSCGSNASKRRAEAAAALGIGYGNTKTFLKKLNAFGISKEELARSLNRKA
jgi:ribonuclease M5